jgi:hypothetical protein
MKTEDREVAVAASPGIAVNTDPDVSEVTVEVPDTMVEFLSGLAEIGQLKQGIVHIVVNEA